MEGRVSPRAQAAGGFPLELEANSSAGDFSRFVRVQSAKRLFRLFRLPAMVGSSYSGNSWLGTNSSPTRASLDHFTLLERYRGDIALSPSRPSRSRREIFPENIVFGALKYPKSDWASCSFLIASSVPSQMSFGKAGALSTVRVGPTYKSLSLMPPEHHPNLPDITFAVEQALIEQTMFHPPTGKKLVVLRTRSFDELDSQLLAQWVDLGDRRGVCGVRAGGIDAPEFCSSRFCISPSTVLFESLRERKKRGWGSLRARRGIPRSSDIWQ